MFTRKTNILVAIMFLSVACFAQKVPVNLSRGVAKAAQERFPTYREFRNAPLPVPLPAMTGQFPEFDAKVTFIDRNQMLDLITNRDSEPLYDKLSSDLMSLAQEKDVSFFGTFVPSQEALWLESQRYTRPEYTGSLRNALDEMLVEAARNTRGYAILKITKGQKAEEKMDPQQTILVMNMNSVSWMKFPTDLVASTVIQPKMSENIFSLKTGWDDPYLFVVTDSSKGVRQGILVYSPADQKNIYDAHNPKMAGTSFHVRITTYGKPYEAAAHTVDGGTALIYRGYKLEYGLTEEGPFFDTVGEVEAYFAEKAKQSQEVAASLKSSTVPNKTQIPLANPYEQPSSPVILPPDPNAPIVKQPARPTVPEKKWTHNSVPGDPAPLMPEPMNGALKKGPSFRQYPTPMQDPTNMGTGSATPAAESTSSAAVKGSNGFPPSYQARNIPGTHGVNSTLVDKPISPVVLDPEPPAIRRSDVDKDGYPVSFRSISAPGMPWTKRRWDGEISPVPYAPMPTENIQKWTPGVTPDTPAPVMPDPERP